ncbi:unnamed protein product [Closterium sp. NIES-64]|nr:unnamed protein product [Closterium sp. NIES-64]
MGAGRILPGRPDKKGGSGQPPPLPALITSPHLLLPSLQPVPCFTRPTFHLTVCPRNIGNTYVSGSLPASLGALPNLTEMAGSSCEIQQNDSSFFCKSLCFDFCASCIPLNGQRRHPPPPPPLSPPLPPSLALMRPPSPSLSSLLAVSSPLSLPPAPPPSTGLPTSAIVGISVGVFCLILAAAAAAVVVCGSSRVFTRSRCPQLSMSLVAQATGGWSEDSWVDKQGRSSSICHTSSPSISTSSSRGQRYRAVNPVDSRQVWFVVRRGNDELSTDFQKEVATLWTIRHTNLQRLLGYCWEKPDTALDCELPPDAVGAAAASHAVEQAEEQVLVFEWVPGGNLHSRLVAGTPSPRPFSHPTLSMPLPLCLLIAL